MDFILRHSLFGLIIYIPFFSKMTSLNIEQKIIDLKKKKRFRPGIHVQAVRSPLRNPHSLKIERAVNYGVVW